MLLTVREAADVLRVTPQRVYELIRAELLPGIRLGRQVRVDEAQLQTWIADGGRRLAGNWRKESDNG
jgi:excisionase family DNA binding protein